MKNLLFTLAVLLPSLTFSMSATTDCDTLVLKNGKVMLVKIEKMDRSEIYFSRCESTDGQVFALPLGELVELKSKKFQLEKKSETAATSKPQKQKVVRSPEFKKLKLRANLMQVWGAVSGSGIAIGLLVAALLGGLTGTAFVVVVGVFLINLVVFFVRMSWLNFYAKKLVPDEQKRIRRKLKWASIFFFLPILMMAAFMAYVIATF